MTDRCPCKCHDPATEDGVDVTDIIEAAVALGCICLPDHCPALLNQPLPRMPMGDTYTVYVEAHPIEKDKGEGRE